MLLDRDTARNDALESAATKVDGGRMAVLGARSAPKEQRHQPKALCAVQCHGLWLVRHIAVALVGLVLAAPIASAANARRGVNAREHRQAQRIREGVKSGEITKAERDRLAGDEAAVRAEERVYRRSGDGLDRAERRDLERDLNKTSREIHRAKHNDRTR
jgi:hypothetical protein